MGYFIMEPDDFAVAASFRTLPVMLTNGLNKFKVEVREKLYGISLLESASNNGRPRPDDQVESFERWEDCFYFECNMRTPDPNRPSVTVIPAVPTGYASSMATVFAPWVDPVSSQVEQGVYCAACRHTKYKEELFTTESFLDHLKDCRVGPIEFFSDIVWYPLEVVFEVFPDITEVRMTTWNV